MYGGILEPPEEEFFDPIDPTIAEPLLSIPEEGEKDIEAKEDEVPGRPTGRSGVVRDFPSEPENDNTTLVIVGIGVVTLIAYYMS